MRRQLEAGHRHAAHAFHAACDDDIGAARDNALGCKSDRLQARRTEPVDRQGRHRRRESGVQRHDTGEIQALLPFGHRASDDDVLYILFLHARHPVNDSLKHRSPQILRTGMGQAAFFCPAYRGADSGNNDGFSHERSPLFDSLSCATACLWKAYAAYAAAFSVRRKG